jgi:hypothetical protein
MSDGPHRSLPMRKPWRELAKRADKLVYDSGQVADAAKDALASDFKNEVSYPLVKALKDIFAGRDNSLGILEIATLQLEEVRSLAAGSVFGMNAVAWSIQLVNEGRLGMDAFYDAIGLAAKERGFANARSVEEHYVRESNQRRASGVSARLQGALSGLSENQLGLMLANPQPARSRARQKRTGLGDGVPL